LQKNIKGLGETGLDIFFRRTQGAWEEASPFVDHRTADALSKLGLPSDAKDLRELVEENWTKLKTGDVPGSNDQAEQRETFVLVLERAVGADLEGNIDDVLNKAAEV
jgi:hypothetical protein